MRLNLLEVIPVVTAAGCKWMESLQALYTFHRGRAPDCDACLLLEDDQLFSPAGLKELRGHLLMLEADRLEVRSEFLWDAEGQTNAEIPEHWGALGWRVYPDDDFPLNFIVRCPRACARSDRVIKLVNPMRDYGWFLPEERERAWAASRAAGRIDAFTLPLVRPPKLVKV